MSKRSTASPATAESTGHIMTTTTTRHGCHPHLMRACVDAPLRSQTAPPLPIEPILANTGTSSAVHRHPQSAPRSCIASLAEVVAPEKP